MFESVRRPSSREGWRNNSELGTIVNIHGNVNSGGGSVVLGSNLSGDRSRYNFG